MDKNIYECHECGQHFISRKENPKTCSKCHSRFWGGYWSQEVKGKRKDGSLIFGKRVPLLESPENC